MSRRRLFLIKFAVFFAFYKLRWFGSLLPRGKGVLTSYIFKFSEDMTYGQIVDYRKSLSEERREKNLVNKYIAENKMVYLGESSFQNYGYGRWTAYFFNKKDFFAFEKEAELLEKKILKKMTYVLDQKVHFLS